MKISEIVTLSFIIFISLPSSQCKKKSKDPSPPVWKKNSRPFSRDSIVSKTEETTIKLQCPARGHPKPSITWYKDGQMFDPRGMDRAKLHRYNLVIEDAVVDDSGDYTCIVVNTEGSLNFTYIVDVIKRTWPLDVEEPLNTTVQEGEMTRLTCRALNDPDATIRWLRQNTSSLNRNLRLTSDFITPKNSAVLIIENTTVGDAGKYTCLIGNYFGIVSKDAWVTVVPKPTTTTTSTTTTTTTPMPTTTTTTTTTATTTPTTTTTTTTTEPTTTTTTPTTTTTMYVYEGDIFGVTDDSYTENERNERKRDRKKKKDKKNKKDRKKKKDKKKKKKKKKDRNRNNGRNDNGDFEENPDNEDNTNIVDGLDPTFDTDWNKYAGIYDMYKPRSTQDPRIYNEVENPNSEDNPNRNGYGNENSNGTPESEPNDNARSIPFTPINNGDVKFDNIEGDKTNAETSENGVSVWTIYIIVGSVAGAVLLVGLVAIVVALCCQRVEDGGYKSTSV